jgi:hypothetical protein
MMPNHQVDRPGLAFLVIIIIAAAGAQYGVEKAAGCLFLALGGFALYKLLARR